MYRIGTMWYQGASRQVKQLLPRLSRTPSLSSPSRRRCGLPARIRTGQRAEAPGERGALVKEMAQSGLFKKGRAPPKTKRVTKMMKRTRKGSSLKAAKRGLDKIVGQEQRARTRQINQANERTIAAKAIQNGERIIRTDVKSKGRALVKEIRRAALAKKKPRIEQKIEKAKEQLAKLGRAG